MKRMHTDEEIQKLAANPIGDVSVDGTISASGNASFKSVDVTKAVYKQNVTPSLPTGFVIASGTEPYIAFVVSGGVLWFIEHIKVTNNSGSNYNSTFNAFPNVAIPEWLAAKIYREDGTTCDKASDTSTVIGRGWGSQDGTPRSLLIESYSARTITAYSAIDLNNGASARYDVRIPILLVD